VHAPVPPSPGSPAPRTAGDGAGAGSRRARGIVKVCGLTTLEDARAAHAAGADWLGFVVRGEGPRVIPPGRAAEIVAALPGAFAVAVLVAPDPAEALSIARAVGASRVQLHRVDPAAWPADFPVAVTFAVPMDGEGHLKGALPAEGSLVLLDRAHAVLAGGTGETLPWEHAAALARTWRLMLAGGLGPDNVGEAIRTVAPWGVDASSRLESSPGAKDHDRVRRYVAAARAAFERNP